VRLEQLDVHYLLSRASFTGPPGGAEKETLRFDGARTQTQSVGLQLPGSAVVLAASLRVEEALGGAELAAFGDDASELPLATGAHLAPTHWVAQALTPPAPILVSALMLAILPLARDTELTIELREDWCGGPGGGVLVAQRLATETAGRGDWYRVSFDAPLVLDSRPCWLRVRCARGSAVWLARTDVELVDNAQAADGPVRVVRAGSTLFAFSSAAGAATAPSARLALAGVALAPDPGEPGSYDLAAALAPLVAGGSAGTTMAFELAFTTSRRGVVTVYPPEIEYEAAG
jgi:hypothetical protein